MNRYMLLSLAYFLTIVLSGFTACGETAAGNIPAEQGIIEDDNSMVKINIKAGDNVFTVILYNNDTTDEFIKQLPLSIEMYELNGNEKYYYLPGGLPVDSKRAGSINAGDFMLYGSDCLVLFYESFTTSYSYTKLGYLEDASGLAEALGNGSVQVMFTVCE